MDTRHIPGLDLGGFLIPGANDLPDLYVHANDPAGWVAMQVAARQPNVDVVSAAAPASMASGLLPDWLTSPDYLANLGKGLAVKIGGMALGLVIVIFALYYFLKD